MNTFPEKPDVGGCDNGSRERRKAIAATRLPSRGRTAIASSIHPRIGRLRRV